jgi:hypothetical protein
VLAFDDSRLFGGAGGQADGMLDVLWGVWSESLCVCVLDGCVCVVELTEGMRDLGLPSSDHGGISECGLLGSSLDEESLDEESLSKRVDEP